MNKRHPNNTNLTLHYDVTWEGLPVLARPDRPLAVNYLEPTRSVLDWALVEHPRTCVIHVGAHLPYGWQGSSGGLANKFIRSLRSQIKFDLQRKRKQGNRVHDCHVRLIWCREFGKEGRPHYHMAVLVNRDAYSALGSIAAQPEPDYPWWLEEEEVEANMAGRIQRAWCSALSISGRQGAGLVHFPRNAVQLIDRGSPMFSVQYAEVFKRLSYMAKVETKLYDDGRRNFGYSHDGCR